MLLSLLPNSENLYSGYKPLAFFVIGAIMKCKDMGRWGSWLGLSYVKGSLLSIVTKTNV